MSELLCEIEFKESNEFWSSIEVKSMNDLGGLVRRTMEQPD